MEIIMIAAMAANRVIGDSRTNDIPWHVPGEQERFKEKTLGHHLIMGRKTYESIGRPLPGRQTVIVTRNHKYQASDCLIAANPTAAIDHCQDSKKVFIVGGETIYRQTFEFCSRLILTTLCRPAQGDIFFPELPKNHFIMESQEKINHPEPYTIGYYRRRL